MIVSLTVSLFRRWWKNHLIDIVLFIYTEFIVQTFTLQSFHRDSCDILTKNNILLLLIIIQ